MTDINLKTETPDTTLPTTGFLFGADSQAAASPSVFTVQSVATTLLGSTTLSGATITADAPVLNLAQTWNNAAITFTGLKANVTDTASASSSLLMDLQVGGVSRVSATKAGNFFANSYNVGNGANGYWDINGPRLPLAASYQWSSTSNATASADLFVSRRGTANLRFGAADAAAPVAQTLSVQSVVAGTSNTAGAALTITGSQGTGTGAGGSIIFQVAPAGSSGTAQNALVQFLEATSTRLFNIYDTYTDASNYRRASMYWSSGVFFIDNDLNAGTGVTNATMTLKSRGNIVLTPGLGGYDVVTNAASSGNFYPGGTTNTTGLGRSDKTFSNGYFGTSVQVAPATAIPAGGTAGLGYRVSSTSNFGVFFGSGAPALSAAKGSLYLCSDGTTTNDRMYVNTDGATTWTAVTTAA
jgi:hypothetical protein